jgi:outer membrane protein TolC
MPDEKKRYRLMRAKKTKIFYTFCAILLLASALPASASDTAARIEKGTVLSLQDCIQIALKTNPQETVARGTALAAGSRIGQAQSAYYPQLSWQSEYARTSMGLIPTIGGSTPALTQNVNPNTSQSVFQTGPTLIQNIYDFGKTGSQVETARLNRDASEQDFENVSLGIIFNVKTYYYGVLQAQRSLEAARKVFEQAQEHLRQAQGFFEAGSKPRIDVIDAKVTLSNSQLSLIQASNAVQLAWQNLNNAMGLPDAPEYNIKDSLDYVPFPITFEEALKRAYLNRPDLKAATARARAARQSVKLAETAYYPAISGNAAYFWTGNIMPQDNGWNVGATLTIPVFNGFLTKKQVAEANANLGSQDAAEKVLRQQIYLQNKQAYLKLKEAESSIETARSGLELAQEKLKLANGRYAAGIGSNIEVNDALTTFTGAQISYINALYSYKVDEASLENAMGME